ncbi:MAG TPA: MFS transporter, partial [Coriobacteriia bacterium]
RTFSSLKVRNYRLYFIGQAISLCGTWMQGVAMGLLVLRLTHSGTVLGLVVALQFAPVLFLAPYGGLLAGRFSKRKLLFVTQSAAGLLALILGVLVLTGTVQLWMIFVLALGLGVVNAVDNPVRQTFVHELVGHTLLGNAVTLNSIIVNLSRVVGPALAGVVAAQFGLAPCFIINGLSFGAVLACLGMMRDGELLRAKRVPPEKGQLREGFAYAWKTPIVRDVLIMMALVGTLSYEFMVSLPLLATITFHASEAVVDGEVALLMAVMGLGAVVGGLLAAGRRTGAMRSLAIGAFGFGIAMLLVAGAPTLLWAAVGMGVVGYFSVTFTALTNTILQTMSAPRMRGRVMALWAMAFMGTTVIGGPIIGWVGQNTGPRWALVVGAIASLGAGVLGLKSVRAGSMEASHRMAAAAVPVEEPV